MDLRLKLLGPMDVHVDGAALPAIRRRKARALLAYVALAERGTVSREVLATLLWEDRNETAARASLRQTLFLLRQHLASDGTSLIHADTESVSIQCVDTDVARFEGLCHRATIEELHAATSLYRGEFLADLNVDGSVFEQWQLSERARLHGLAAGAMERLATMQLDNGDSADAIVTGRRLLSLDVLCEPGHRLLMRALTRSGQRSAALEQYQFCQRVLAEELGVKPERETERLLKQIRANALTPCEDSMDPARADVFETAADKHAALTGGLERRLVTILRCDLMGPADHCANLDAEVYRELLLARQEIAKDVISRFAGHAAQHMEASLLAYFGYPQAHEDDAERAVRAGLAVIESLSALDSRGVASYARIGIATDVVVAGEQIGEGFGTTEVVGNAGRIAEQLQSQASPNAVVVSAATAELVSSLFTLEALDPSATTSAYRVICAVAHVSRFAGRAARRLSPFVGRDEELTRLSRRWVQARQGRGGVELITGEAGIGKSRLIHEFLSRQDPEPSQVVTVQCSPHRESSALYPIITSFEHTLGFADIPSAEQRLERLRRYLVVAGQSDKQMLGLLAHLLAIPTTDEFSEVGAMTAAARRELTLNALAEHINMCAQQAPLRYVFEDVHWADPTTLELLNRLVERADGMPVLFIATTRPGFEAGWTDLAPVQILTLSRLGQEFGAQLAQAVAPQRGGLGTEVLAAVLDRADGNPLFIEELTQAALETVTDSAAPERDKLPGEVSIPLTLRDSLLERLDRLGEAKALAQAAAVIGREFTSAPAAAILSRTEEWADVQLERLVQARVVYRRGTPPSIYYVFKHALLQDAAYDSLLAANRKQLHASLVDVLSTSEVIGAEPEILARHSAAAELFDRAVNYSIQAAEKFARSSSLSEARQHWWTAIRTLNAHPELPNRTRRQVEAAIALANHSREAVDPAYVEVVERAVDQSAQLKDDGLMAEAQFALARVYGGMGRRNDEHAILEKCCRIAERSGNRRIAALAESNIARLRYVGGEIERAIAALPATVEKLESVGEWGHLAASSSTTGNFAGWLGRFDYGLELVNEALQWAKKGNDKDLEAMCCLHKTMLHGTRGELSDALSYSEQGIELARTVGNPFVQSITTMLKGYYLYVLGGDADGITLQVEGIEGHVRRRAQFMLSLHFAQLAECLALAGELSRAKDFASRSIDRVQDGERIGLSNAYLALALTEARANPGNWDAAKDWFEKAETLAKSRGERPLLGKIYFHQSRTFPPVDWLTPLAPAPSVRMTYSKI